MAVTHLLVDYGEVISRPLPEATVARLAAVAGVPTDELVARYWRVRPGYDAGQSPRDYWRRVVADPVALDDARVAELVGIDTAGWLHVDPRVLEVLAGEAGRGRRLALLSNAPHPLAEALDGCRWAGLFEHRIFSCRIGVAKPDRRAFEAALAVTGAAPGDTLFIDDRPANTAAASRLGMATITFTSAVDLLRRLRPGPGDGVAPSAQRTAGGADDGR